MESVSCSVGRREGRAVSDTIAEIFCLFSLPLRGGRRSHFALCAAPGMVPQLPTKLRQKSMQKPALALLIHGGAQNWSPQRWKARFDDACRGRRVVLLPDAVLDPAEVHYAAVWKPAPGALAAFPNLRAIFNLGAGVDALMADSSLPDVPLVRIAVDDLTARMTEYVVLHVLMHHRQELYLRASQREKIWAPKVQWPASAISVGIMGLGVLGSSAATALRHLGFRVSGWSRSEKNIGGIECFHGHDQIDRFLQRTNVLVSLLPLTPDTRHILNRGLFAKLNGKS